MNRDELFLQLQALADGQSSPEEESELRRLIESDAEARASFESILALKTLIRASAGNVRTPAGLAETLRERSLDAGTGRFQARIGRFQARTGRFRYRLAAAAIVLIGLIIMITGDTRKIYAHSQIVPSCVMDFREINRECLGAARDVIPTEIRIAIESLDGEEFPLEIPTIYDGQYCRVVKFQCPENEAIGGYRIDYSCICPKTSEAKLVSIYIIDLSKINVSDGEQVPGLNSKAGHPCGEACGRENTPVVVCAVTSGFFISLVADLDEGTVRERFSLASRQ